MVWLTVPLAFLIYLGAGDPAGLPHPVKYIGLADLHYYFRPGFGPGRVFSLQSFEPRGVD